MNLLESGLDMLDLHAGAMGVGLTKPKRSSKRDMLLGVGKSAAEHDAEEALNPTALGRAAVAPGVAWQCHCCTQDNRPTATKCRCCGRPPGYRRTNASRPLMLPDCVAALRSNQIDGYLDGVVRAKCGDMTPAARDKYLAGKDGPINAADERGFTPIHVAAAAGNAGAVEVLLRRGALVEARTKPQGWRALHLAAASGSPETVAALLGGGASVDPKTSACARTPLHLCADGRAAQILIDAGADPWATDVQGRTPLHHAAERGAVDVGDAVVGAAGNRALEVADGDNWLPEATAEYYHRHDFVRFCRLLEAEAQHKLVEELPGRAWAGDVWDAGMRQYAKRQGNDAADGGGRNALIVDERLSIRNIKTRVMMENHAAETRRVWRAVERERDAAKLLEDEASAASAGSASHSTLALAGATATTALSVARAGTEGTMPPTGAAPVFDEYLAGLKDDETDPVACRRRNVYSKKYDPLVDVLNCAIRPEGFVPHEPLSLARTPRECHSILFGGER